MRKLSQEELRELASQLVAGKISADEYLRAVLGEEPQDLEPLPMGPSAAQSARQGVESPEPRASHTALPPRQRLTDAEIDALVRRAKALL